MDPSWNRDQEATARNVRRLEGVVGGLTHAWQAELDEVEAQIPVLLGDSTLAAAAVVYLGALQPAQRAAALQAWHALLQAEGISCSSCFSFQRFVSLREAQLLGKLAPDVRAAASPGFLEAITLVSLSPRPPLLVDPHLEAPPLLKALQGLARERTAHLHGSPAAAAAAAAMAAGGKSAAGNKGVTGRAFFTIYDEDLPSRVEGAVAAGKAVVVEMFGGTHSEAALLEQVVVAYEGAMRRLFGGSTLAPHLLCVRLKTSSQPLPPTLHALLSPVRVGVEVGEVRGRLEEAVLSLVALPSVAMRRELTTKAWELDQECNTIQASVVNNVAHTRGPVFADDALVDATIAKAQQVSALRKELPKLHASLQAISDIAGVTYAACTEAGTLVLEMLMYLAAHDPTHLAMHAHMYVPIFKAAARKALRSVGLLAAPAATWAGGSKQDSPRAVSPMAAARKRRHSPRRPTSQATSHQVPRSPPRHQHQNSHAPRARSPPVSPGSVTAANSPVGSPILGQTASELLTAPASPPPAAITLTPAQQEALHKATLTALVTLLSGLLSEGHLAALRLLLALATLSKKGAITAGEHQFVVELLRTDAQPPPGASQELRRGVTAAGVLRATGTASGAAAGGSVRPGSMLGAAGSHPSPLAALIAGNQSGVTRVSTRFRPSQSMVMKAGSTAGAGQAPSLQEGDAPGGEAGMAALSWLEASYPTPAFAGITSAVAAAPAAWRAALQRDDLSRPAAVAAAAAAACQQLQLQQQAAATGQGPLSLSGASILGGTSIRAPRIDGEPSLSQLAAAAGQHLSQRLGSRVIRGDMSFAGTPVGSPGGVPGSQLEGHDSQEAPLGPHPLAAPAPSTLPSPSLPSLSPSTAQIPADFLLGLASVDSAALGGPVQALQAALPLLSQPEGPLPEQWARARLRSPLHWFLLATLSGPESRLASTAEWLAEQVLGSPQPCPSSGERLLTGVLTGPAATPLLVTSKGCEEILLALHQAQSACTSLAASPSNEAAWGGLEVPKETHLGEREVIPHYWDPEGFSELKGLLLRAMRAGAWLVLLNTHTAPRSQLLELLELVASKEYLLRGEDVTFRLFLALPHAALPALPRVAYQQTLQVVLEPPTSLAAYVRGMLQLVAHPTAAYVGFFAKSSERELQLAGLGTMFAMAALSKSLPASCAAPDAPSVASPFSWWDLLHALHLTKCATKLSMAEGGQYEGPTGEPAALEHARLQELLLADVFLAACPLPSLVPHVTCAVTRLVSPSVLAADYPVHLLARDRDADATETTLPPTDPWPFQASRLRDVAEYLDKLLGEAGVLSVSSRLINAAAAAAARSTSPTAPTPPLAPSPLLGGGQQSSAMQGSAAHVLAAALGTGASGTGSGVPATTGGLAELMSGAPLGHRPPHLHRAHQAALSASLTGQGRWPLSVLLQYQGAARGVLAAHESHALHSVMQAWVRPLPGVPAGWPAPAATLTTAGSTLSGLMSPLVTGAMSRLPTGAAPSPLAPGGLLTPVTPHSALGGLVTPTMQGAHLAGTPRAQPGLVGASPASALLTPGTAGAAATASGAGVDAVSAVTHVSGSSSLILHPLAPAHAGVPGDLAALCNLPAPDPPDAGSKPAAGNRGSNLAGRHRTALDQPRAGGESASSAISAGSQQQHFAATGVMPRLSELSTWVSTRRSVLGSLVYGLTAQARSGPEAALQHPGTPPAIKTRANAGSLEGLLCGAMVQEARVLSRVLLAAQGDLQLCGQLSHEPWLASRHTAGLLLALSSGWAPVPWSSLLTAAGAGDAQHPGLSALLLESPPVSKGVQRTQHHGCAQQSWQWQAVIGATCMSVPEWRTLIDHRLSVIAAAASGATFSGVSHHLPQQAAVDSTSHPPHTQRQQVALPPPVAADIAAALGDGECSSLPLDVMCLAAAPLAVLMRAHAHEQSVYVGNVACRAVAVVTPQHHHHRQHLQAPGLTSSTDSLATTEQQRDAGMARKGFAVSGLSLHDGALLPFAQLDMAGHEGALTRLTATGRLPPQHHQPGSAAAAAAAVTPPAAMQAAVSSREGGATDPGSQGVLLLHEVAASQVSAPCGMLHLVPAFADPHVYLKPLPGSRPATVRSARGPAGAGRQLLGSGVGTGSMRAVTPSPGSAEGGSTSAVGPGATHPLALPVLPHGSGPLGLMAGVAPAVSLLVDARQPYFSQSSEVPDSAAGAGLQCVVPPPVPPHARTLYLVPKISVSRM